MKFSFLLAVVVLTLVGGVAAGQDEKFEAVILVPSAMKVHAVRMPKSLPFIGKALDCPTKVLVGVGLDGAKKEPDVRFTLQLHTFTHIAGNMQFPGGFNRVEYSLHYRPADAEKPTVLLAKGTAQLEPGDPKKDLFVFGTLGFAVADDLADALAPKLFEAKPAPFALATLNGSIKRNAYAATHVNDGKGGVVGSLSIKNKLPVQVEIGKLAFVSQLHVTGKTAAEQPNTFVELATKDNKGREGSAVELRTIRVATMQWMIQAADAKTLPLSHRLA
jgi:hypothetical protein